MRKIFSLALGLGFLAGTLSAGNGFEGVVTMDVTGPQGNTRQVQYSAKGHKLRMDIEVPGGQKMAMLIDNATRTSVMLFAQKKLAMTTQLQEPQGNGRADKHSLVKTGKTQMILGYSADQYLANGADGKQVAEIWAASGLGSFRMLPGNAGAHSHGGESWESEFRDKGFFPLKVIGKATSMEVTKIEKKSLDASLFEVPADYKSMDLGAIRQGAQP